MLAQLAWSWRKRRIAETHFSVTGSVRLPMGSGSGTANNAAIEKSSAPPDFAPLDASWKNTVDVCALKFFGRGVMFRGTRMLDETETVSTLNPISPRVSLLRLVVTLCR